MSSKFSIPKDNQKYILFGGYVSRATAVQMVLEELHIEYEYRTVVTRDNEHMHPDFLKLNSAGYVPVLVTPENKIMHEAAAICLWLMDHYKADSLAPLPEDSDRMRFLEKLFFITNDIQPPTKQFTYAHRYCPTEETHLKTKMDAKTRTLERWSVLNNYLEENGPHVLGGRQSFVDLYLCMWASYGLEFNDDILGRFSAISKCFDVIVKRPISGEILETLRNDVLSYKPAMSEVA